MKKSLNERSFGLTDSFFSSDVSSFGSDVSSVCGAEATIRRVSGAVSASGEADRARKQYLLCKATGGGP